MAANDLIFTVDRGDAAATAERLCSAGVSVSRELKSIGVINGTADDAEVENLKSIPGVLSVERSRDFQLAPPDSPVQ